MAARDDDRDAPELPPEVVEALRANRKIEAIKLLREATGLGLREAKERIEAEATPAQGAGAPTVKRGTRGAGPVLIALIVAAVAAYLWLTRD